MNHQFNPDAVLNSVIESNPRVPGVVAMATDRHSNIYEGAAGVRNDHCVESGYGDTLAV